MPYFVISGKPNCPKYVHALHVAQYLAEKLPEFLYKQVEKMGEDWAIHLIDLNKRNKWFISDSPLIWKEISMWGGRKYLIGGLSEFWEYVYCYYGLESFISREELKKLAADNLKFFVEHKETTTRQQKDVRIIAILGASNLMTPFLLDGLVELEELKKQEGIDVKLYDNMTITEQKYSHTIEYAKYINGRNLFGTRNVVNVVASLKEAITDSDILIHAEDFTRYPSESVEAWIERCYSRMNFLSEMINLYGKRNLRIIMNNHGPVCFLTTCLVEFCTRIQISNIIAVTADKGLSTIGVVSEKTGIPVRQISAPPVWGFVGVNAFVDERNIVFKADIYRPYERSLTAPAGSTLALGTIKSELRLMSYLLSDHHDIAKEVERRKSKIKVKMEHEPVFSKVRAAVSVLKLWFAEERPDDIISLGICSNGSFDIPAGIVFSQPGILDGKRKWIPYTKFPLMNDFTKSQIKECVAATMDLLKICGFSKRGFEKDDFSSMTSCSEQDLNDK